MTIYTQHTSKTSGFFYEGNSIHKSKSEFQNIEIVDTEQFGRCLLLDGAMMLSSKQEYLYHNSLIDYPVTSLEKIELESALVIGGGDLFSTNYLTKYPFGVIDVIEIDKQVVEVSKEYFKDQLPNINDPRVNIQFMDAFHAMDIMVKLKVKYKFIALDLTDPSEEDAIASKLFGVESQQNIKVCLAEGGLMVAQISCPYTNKVAFYNALKVMRGMYKHVTVYGEYIPMYGCYQFFAACSDVVDMLAVTDITRAKNIVKYDLDVRNTSINYGRFDILCGNFDHLPFKD